MSNQNSELQVKSTVHMHPQMENNCYNSIIRSTTQTLHSKARSCQIFLSLLTWTIAKSKLGKSSWTLWHLINKRWVGCKSTHTCWVCGRNVYNVTTAQVNMMRKRPGYLHALTTVSSPLTVLNLVCLLKPKLITEQSSRHLGHRGVCGLNPTMATTGIDFSVSSWGFDKNKGFFM